MRNAIRDKIFKSEILKKEQSCINDDVFHLLFISNRRIFISETSDWRGEWMNSRTSTTKWDLIIESLHGEKKARAV